MCGCRGRAVLAVEVVGMGSDLVHVCLTILRKPRGRKTLFAVLLADLPRSGRLKYLNPFVLG